MPISYFLVCMKQVSVFNWLTGAPTNVKGWVTSLTAFKFLAVKADLKFLDITYVLLILWKVN